MMLLAAMTVKAQGSTPDPQSESNEQNTQSEQSEQPEFLINIGGNVYGGGNAGDLDGNTKVSVYGGYLTDVYGGARMANVGGSTFVNIDGKNASDDIFIVNVYGGNDISGTIGQGTVTTTVPTESGELENIWKTAADNDDKTKNKIDNTWKTFIHTSASDPLTIGEGENAVTGDSKMLAIGSLFGGGNGDYTYGTKTTGEGESATTTYIAKVGETEVAESATELKAPELSKTYLEIKGGCIAHVYGGGNNATVTEATTICIDNESSDLVSMGTVYAAIHQKNPNVLLGMLRARMALTTFQSNLTSWAFNHARVFGGNNKAAMAIMPKWNLQRGIIRDLFSGGNEGAMTCENGLVLDIDPAVANNDKLFISNVYGGCRRADVRPLKNGVDVTAYPPEGNTAPIGLAARTMVRGGQITNVYGGNDISGKVYGGNAIGIYTSILGDVYGGGNGSYAYTDNDKLATMDEYKDFYYNPGSNSIEALNAFRPNAEQVSLRLYGGEDSNKPIVIKGSVFVGGNSATLKKKEGVTAPRVELKIGSNVIVNNVFLGNNGANMIKYENDNDVLKIYKQYVDADGQLSDTGSSDRKFNSIDLTDANIFKKYMEGCALDLLPSVVFDNSERGDGVDYIAYSTQIGSFYCGGNVGSMTSAGTTTIDFAHKVVIFDKLVGGCNSAIVKAVDGYNARYEGGLIGENTDETGNKLVLNLSGLKIQPKRWNDAGTELIWNTIDSRGYDVETKTYPKMDPVTSFPNNVTEQTSNDDDLARRLFGGNIYGGCCESGIVNGNVVINLNETIIERDKLFDVVESGELGEENSLYGASQTGKTNYLITKRNTGVILGQQGMDVFGQALNVFGGGKGKNTEIWGSTTINLNKGYTFQIFGGSEEGTIGKPTGTTEAADLTYASSGSTLTYNFNGKKFVYNPAYSCYVNLCGTIPGVSKSESNQNDNMADCEFMYGGGFFGPICGNTVINLGAGRIFNSFAGSCNADILGHTETFIGRQIKAHNKYLMGKLGSTEVVEGDPTSYILDHDTCYQAGFTWIRDITYGANDLGGRIFGSKDFTNRVRKASDAYGLDVLNMVHKYDASNNPNPEVLTAGAYTEYLQGRADAIFGGCYGTYNYSDPKFKRYTFTEGETVLDGFDLGDSKLDSNKNPLFYKPRVHNAFVNFRPTYYNTSNVVKRVFGAGQGESGEKERDLLQDRSYVLIDIPQIAETTGSSGSSETSESSESSESANFNKYGNMEVFGAGAWGGVGMKYTYSETMAVDGQDNPTFDLDRASAIIDLVRGDIGAAYGASYEEGVTRRTLVNVPQGSTIKIGSIFGGGYGTETYKPCDVYEAHVEYHSPDAVLVNNRPRVDANGQNLGNPLMLGAIYGGNNNQRRTIYGFINIDVPVRQSHYQYGMTTGNVYGAGYGSRTWNEYTQIDLNRGAEVFEVYGGGEAGGVMSAESVEKYVKELKPNIAENTPMLDEDWRVAWTLGSDYDPSWDSFDYVNNTATNLSNPIVREAEMDDRSTKTFNSTKTYKKYNTNVIINEGAYVGNYAYGGGYGKEDDKFAGSGDVYGTTYIALLGGTVNKDIYAAGTSGAVYDLFGVGAYDATKNPKGFTASANAYIKGGTVRNVYGGGWRGSVGYHQGAIAVVANNESDRLGEAHVVIGDIDGTDHLNGIPSITRNVYGGGEGGAIFGDAFVTINNGYIGYRYNSTLNNDASTELDDRYVPELDDKKPGDNDLEKGGNVFGGGYVANSYVDRTHINMWDGIVRGSLYGGGEIGPVGRGTVHADSIAKYPSYVMHDYGFDGCQPAAIYKGGETHVYLWGGHVMRDVFGGGRGYDNWNGEGYFQSDEEKNNMDRSSKGYVFGSTDVHIRGGEIGTEEGMLKGYGNVFGGGNEGYVYSTTGKKVGTDRSDEHLTKGKPTDGGGFYYVNPVTSVDSNGKTVLTSDEGLSHDCYIAIEPYCKVIANGGISGFTANTTTGVKTSYAKGEYVPLAALNQLQNRNKDQGTDETAGPKKWDKLDTSGITIHNALFAGGNITEGSDNLYANTVTVYGNAAVSLRDAYNYDLISLGTEEMGGLYGDGNLTLVDGFRELHIDNYGTDYYSLKETLELKDYEKLSDRQKAYYKLKYVSSDTHTFYYWECQELYTFTYTIGEETFSETYKRGQKISNDDYTRLSQYLSEAEKKKWQQGQKAFQKNDQIEESEYILMYGDENSGEKRWWKLFGVTNIYDGRPLNTIQRADMCGVFGSRMVLKGAEDRVVDAVDYHLYTINRVDEVSLNKNVSQAGDTDDKDKVHGNYFGIFSEVNYLGNLTSDVFFTETDQVGDKSAIRKTDTSNEANQADGQTTYYAWKAAKPQAKNRNNGISHNKVALASGVYLEIKREEGELTGEDDWGYITGVVELDLINVMQGMGGGYVYARNEHGTKTWHGGTSDPYGKVTMLAENQSARTYRRFTYEKPNANGSNLQQIETSGNFVHNTKQIVDDCYPHGGVYKDGYTKSPAHYWFIRGTIYVYDQYISAYTGAANAYAEKVEMPLTISAASNGRMTLREVQPNYYAYFDKNGNKLGDQASHADDEIIINNVTYKLNDPVSYWNYRLMSDAEKARFVKETYVVIDSCKIGENYYPAGYVMMPSEYEQLQTAAQSNMKVVDSGDNAVAVPVPAVQKVTADENGNEVDVVDERGDPVYAAFDYVFRPSNNLSSNTGYVLTYDVNNPMVWNNYYNLTTSPGQANAKNTDEYQALNDVDQKAYIEGPTYTPKQGKTSVYGQENKKFGDIIPGKVKTEYDKEGGVKANVAYTAVPSGTTLTKGKTYYTSNTGTGKFTATGNETANGSNYYTNGQAKVEELAYVVTKEYSVKNTDGTEKQHLNPGTPIYEKNYTPDQWQAITGIDPNTHLVTGPQSAEKAFVCTSLIEFSASDYVYAGKLMTASEIAALKSKVIAKYKYVTDDNGTADAKAQAFLESVFDDAYYCTEEGLYGGTYFETGKAYSAIDSWCSITADERKNFDFNYDALDLLVDPTFSNRDENNYGYKPQYDGWRVGGENEAALVALSDKKLNPQIYSKTQPIDYTAECTKTGGVTYYGPDGTTQKEIPQSTTESMWLSRPQYEAIPNEKHYYSPITVTTPGTYYVVNTVCMEGDVPYTVGQVIDEATYTSMSNKDNVTRYTFTEEQTNHQKVENGQPVFDEHNNPVYNPITYFYCREAFEIGAKGGYASGAYPTIATTAITKDNSGVTSTSHTKGQSTIKGEIINQANYDKLCNFQQGFLIHGVSPTEVSTLYVSSESDIHDLSTEKIITVIYLYEYEESDESGNNVVPVSERHIVNIHINFKSGVPEIGAIKKPDIVLPGTTIGMNVPSVSQGAYRVTESGWELFDNESDARTHTNGHEYINNETKVYWYQNDYWIAYYAQTYLGKTYSNSVQISVANFHDLAKVMGDVDHHYYIDHKDVDYEPKIYINDYTTNDPTTTQNGLDLFKNLIDLSYVTKTYDSAGNPIAISDANSPLNGHVPLENNPSKPMKGGKYLEFFLNADQDHSGSAWTPIANEDGKCFEGILHGDGHTISGLAPADRTTGSLFHKLCGEVYNLGVTGSFTGAGIVDTGEGYVENCWVKSTNSATKTARPVFGDPTREADDAKGTVQVVNSYYLEDDDVAYEADGTTPAAGSYTKQIADAAEAQGYVDHGTPVRKNSQAFYNGEVAYNLNGFYLWKRYCDQKVSSSDNAQKYQYYTVGSDNNLTLQEAKYYESEPTLCSSGYKPSSATSTYVSPKYVEDRFADGDFIYVGDGLGTIPKTPNERLYVDPDTKEESYHAIWPDDYIFFGQALNYGHMDGKNGRDNRTHQDLPSVIKKSNDRVVTTKEGNRVYRAPAYFRSKKMGLAYFNPYAVFAAEEKLTAEQIARTAYPGMTAIDFTGSNGDLAHGYAKGLDASAPYADITGGAFFPPLLDDGGVKEFFNADLTQNLLAYTMTSTSAASQTNEAVSAYMADVVYSETSSKYHTVDAWSGSIGGHWVQKQSDSYVAPRDHMLVDRQDFNAPIGYSFAVGHRMWYQRMPDNYVGQKTVIENEQEKIVYDTHAGWEGVSLPFKADIVTTDVKGEITHFYEGSWESKESKNNTGSKIGHEYWLREFKEGGSEKTVNEKTVYEAKMVYPDANNADGDKENTNTFLWDFYYSYNGYRDMNDDKYQEDDYYHNYYMTARTHEAYPRLAAAMPYIIGFPGQRYYEFDLSGKFEAVTAKEAHKIDGEIIGAQTITFASAVSTKNEPVVIAVSDDEITAMVASTTYGGYTFKPSYLNSPEVTTGKHAFLLSNDGDCYNEDNVNTATAAVVAFRPYFEAAPRPAGSTRTIVFGSEQPEDQIIEQHGDPTKEELNGGLHIYTRKGKIYVKSSLSFTEDLRVVTPAGVTVATLTVKPGQTVEVQADFSGMYVVHTLDGLYTRKVAVKRE